MPHDINLVIADMSTLPQLVSVINIDSSSLVESIKFNVKHV